MLIYDTQIERMLVDSKTVRGNMYTNKKKLSATWKNAAACLKPSRWNEYMLDGRPVLSWFYCARLSCLPIHIPFKSHSKHCAHCLDLYFSLSFSVSLCLSPDAFIQQNALESREIKYSNQRKFEEKKKKKLCLVKAREMALYLIYDGLHSLKSGKCMPFWKFNALKRAS